MENDRGKGVASQHMRTRSGSRRSQAVSVEDAPNAGSDKDSGSSPSGLRVPVNEDFLFDVDIEQRELAPVYWLGPIYEVRRGTWFVSHFFLFVHLKGIQTSLGPKSPLGKFPSFQNTHKPIY